MLQELNEHFTITQEEIAFFSENGYIKIKNVLSPQLVQYMNQCITSAVDHEYLDKI
jgi:N-acetylglutamate synthase-like GNAT family acetyltransferase